MVINKINDDGSYCMYVQNSSLKSCYCCVASKYIILFHGGLQYAHTYTTNNFEWFYVFDAANVYFFFLFTQSIYGFFYRIQKFNVQF